MVLGGILSTAVIIIPPLRKGLVPRVLRLEPPSRGYSSAIAASKYTKSTAREKHSVLYLKFTLQPCGLLALYNFKKIFALALRYYTQPYKILRDITPLRLSLNIRLFCVSSSSV